MGDNVCWPNANRGIVATLHATEDDAEHANISPFAGAGIQVGIEITKHYVWIDGAAAQIESIWGVAPISFFDLTFLSNRAWYEAGKRREFILAGSACEAGAPELDKLVSASESQLAIWQRTHAGIAEGKAAYIGLEGSSIFVPIMDCDRDDYRFRGPVAFGDWMGQSW